MVSITLGMPALGAPAETVIYNFGGAAGDGSYPIQSLALDVHGSLYGTTEGGGAHNLGTIFKLTPSSKSPTGWSETILHSFKGGSSDGASPNGAVVIDATGAVYGTTQSGGEGGLGTVFKLTPPASGKTVWTQTVLHSFEGGNDGATPQAGVVIGANGVLYGTTYAGGGGGTCSAGCGVVFDLVPRADASHLSYKETVLHAFTGGADDGRGSDAALSFGASGALFGTTQNGGSNDAGTVFELIPPAAGTSEWLETTIYSFNGSTDGAYPNAGLLVGFNGVLYGTTAQGGTTYPGGTIFQLAPPAGGSAVWTETVLHNFTGTITGPSTDGTLPHCVLVANVDGDLFGTTDAGGTASASYGGTVFELKPSSAGGSAWTETVLHSFTGGTGDGIGPAAGLVMDRHGNLYGTTNSGGRTSNGTVFKVTR
jgi:uncharacterized repeat protein (TIGR03803 family)